jgi:hypothetical protein
VFFVWRALIGRLVQEPGLRFFGCNYEDGFDNGISLRPRITRSCPDSPHTAHRAASTVPSAIRPLLLRVLGGALAPAKYLRGPQRCLANMATVSNGVQGGVAESSGVTQADGKRTKLHGRAFYESIGSPKLVLAPMVEQSEFVRFLSPPSSPLSRCLRLMR